MANTSGFVKGLGNLLKETGKKAVKSYKAKRDPSKLVQKINPKLTQGDELAEATKAAKTFKRKVGVGKFVGGALTAYGAQKGYSAYQKSPYKIKVSIEKKDGSESSKSESKSVSSKTPAAKVTAARKEQVAANKQKVKAASQQYKATTNKEKVAANKAKVTANAKMVAANKKKVEANKARYKKG